MKVVFIDIDGVLLPGRAHRLPPTGYPDPRVHRLDPVAIDMLRELVVETGAKLVWSSSWRTYGKGVLARIIRENEMDPRWFHSSPITPDRKHDRIAEIRAWLGEHEPAEWFALDDDAELQSDIAANYLNDPEGMRRPRFSKYDGITALIYSQASVVLGRDRFAARYRIGVNGEGMARLFVAYPQTWRLRALSPDCVVGNFVCAGGIWLRLDGIVQDPDVIANTTRTLDVNFGNDLRLGDVRFT